MLASAAVFAPFLAAAAAAALAAADPDGAAAAPALQARPPDSASTAEVLAPPQPVAADVVPPRSWFLLPMVFWLPETRAGLAIVGGRDFRLEGSGRASNAFLIAAYSMEKVGSLEGVADVWFPGGSLLATRFRAVNYPDTYYGLGPASPEEGSEDFLRRFVELSVSWELAFLDGRFRAGPRAAGRVEEIQDLVPGGRLETSGLPGVDGFTGIGVGGSVTWDTRDQPLWPRRGAFAQAYYVRYPAALGRNDGFGKGAVDLRWFLPLGAKPVLALSTVVETTDGATPFSLLSKLGSPRFLRGYREGRWRDREVWAAQAELRVPIAGPLAATAFGAAGDVAPDLADIRVDRLKVAGGAGLRWRVTPAGATLRLDCAVGDAGPQVYFVLLEAF